MSLIDRIISTSLRQRTLVLLLTAVAVVAGVVCFQQTPVDAFPDVTQTKVTIITQWPGRSAEEIEKFVSIPIEIAMNSVQQKTDIRSTTLFGLSVVTVTLQCRPARRREPRSATALRPHGRGLSLHPA